MPKTGTRRTDPPESAALGDSRARVLEVLQTSPARLGVGEVAARVGLHPNTVRFHLDGLVERDLVERGNERRDVPGRPRALYGARPDRPAAGRRSYRFLAQILAGYISAQVRQSESAALEAGEVWGRTLVERPDSLTQTDPDTATEQLTNALDDIGFAPVPVISDGERQILLHHCPFREVAEQHTEVVCNIHLGLMRGVLSELGAPLEVTRLDPFVQPGLCVTHLAAQPER